MNDRSEERTVAELIEYLHDLVSREVAFVVREQIDELYGRLAHFGGPYPLPPDLRKALKPARSPQLESLMERVQALEEWRLSVISAETLGLPVSEQEREAVLPVRYYVGTDDRNVADDVEHALEIILDDIGFRIAATYPIVRGSWFRKLFFMSREKLTPQQVAESVAKIERAAGVRALDLPQSQVDQNRADGVAKLLTALEKCPTALVQIGSICIIKIDGTPIVVNLTPRELSELEREPTIFSSPAEALSAIRKLRHQDQASPRRAIAQGSVTGSDQHSSNP